MLPPPPQSYWLIPQLHDIVGSVGSLQLQRHLEQGRSESTALYAQKRLLMTASSHMHPENDIDKIVAL